MSKFTKPKISKDDLKIISKRRHDHVKKQIRKRLNILWFCTVSDDASKIARYAGVSIRQVFNIVKMYNEYGLHHVMTLNPYKRESKLDGFSDLIKEEFEKNPPNSIKEAKIRIKQITGLKRSETQIRIFLKKLGMKLLKPMLIPMSKSDGSIEEKTKEQKEYVADKLGPALKEAELGKRKVLFMDACHIQLACILGFIWCFAKKYIKSLPLRGRVNVIGACSAYGGDFIYDITQETIDQNAVSYFLYAVRNKIKDGKITLVLDNARYQKTPYVLAEAKKLGIDLLFLPPSSPNLNIIERLWKFIKKTFVANNIFTSLNELEGHLKKSLSTLKSKYKNKLHSLLTTNFQHFDGTVQFYAA